MKKYLILALAVALMIAPAAYAQNVDNYTEQGGARTVIGGALDVASGGELDIESGGAFKIGGTSVTATAAEINLAADISTNFEVVAATNVLTTAECGKTMTLAHATEFVTTLPAPTAGCEFGFIVGLAPSGANYTIVTTGSETIKGVAFDMTGGAVSAGAGTAAADTITLVGGTALAGDRVNLFSDGTSWHGLAFSSSSGAITYTSAQ